MNKQTFNHDGRHDWTLLSLATILFAFGFAVYTGIFQNFFRDVLNGAPLQLGVLESFRELPGLMTALTAALLVGLAEPRLAGIALAVTAVGISATGHVRGVGELILVSAAWSVGAHLWFSLSPAIVMALARGRDGGRHLGRISAFGSGAVLVALATSRLIKPFLSYQTMFHISAALILAAAVCASLISANGAGQKRQPIIFRRAYGRYYLLTFLEGCRRQVFSTFASFVLILVYGMRVESMLMLALANALITTIAAPITGRLIDRLGERRVLMVYYVALIAVFAGYSLFGVRGVLIALFMLDSLLFTCSNAITVFLNRIAKPADMTPSLAMGTTMNHVAAVVIPISGAFLWDYFHDYRIPFWIGMLVALASLATVIRMPREPATRRAEGA